MAASLWRQRIPPRAGASLPPLAESLFDPGDRMFAVDSAHRITFWNAASERFLHIPARDALGSTCYSVVGGCDMQGQRLCGPGCRIARLAKGGAAPRGFPLSVNDGEGRKRDVWVSIILTPSAHHGLWSVLHVLRHADAPAMRQGSAGAQAHAAAAPRSSSRALAPSASLLTAREQDVLQLVAEGLSTATIAQRLYISGVTVRNHIQHILTKLQLHSKVEAVAYAYRHQLIKPPVHGLTDGGEDGDKENRGARPE